MDPKIVYFAPLSFKLNDLFQLFYEFIILGFESTEIEIWAISFKSYFSIHLEK